VALCLAAAACAAGHADAWHGSIGPAGGGDAAFVPLRATVVDPLCRAAAICATSSSRKTAPRVRRQQTPNMLRLLRASSTSGLPPDPSPDDETLRLEMAAADDASAASDETAAADAAAEYAAKLGNDNEELPQDSQFRVTDGKLQCRWRCPILNSRLPPPRLLLRAEDRRAAVPRVL